MQENQGSVEYKEKRELHLHLLDSLTAYIKIMCMFNTPLQCEIQTSTETQLHLQYYTSIKLVEKVKLIAKCQKLLSRHGLVTC